jgi:hypothetical protein
MCKSRVQALAYNLSLIERLVLPVQDTFLDIAVNLPAIRGMGLLNVDDKERHLIAEPVVNLFHAPHLGAEGGQV